MNAFYWKLIYFLLPFTIGHFSIFVQKEKVVKELQEKLQQSTKQHQLDVENMKSKLIIERHERDKERSDHAVMIRQVIAY